MFSEYPEWGELRFPPHWLDGTDPEDAEKGWEETVAAQKNLGDKVQLISPQEIAKLQPGVLTDDLTVGIHEPFAGYADPVETTSSYGKEAEKLGHKSKQTHPLKIKAEHGTKEIQTDKGTFRANHGPVHKCLGA